MSQNRVCTLGVPDVDTETWGIGKAWKVTSLFAGQGPFTEKKQACVVLTEEANDQAPTKHPQDEQAQVLNGSSRVHCPSLTPSFSPDCLLSTSSPLPQCLPRPGFMYSVLPMRKLRLRKDTSLQEV